MVPCEYRLTTYGSQMVPYDSMHGNNMKLSIEHIVPSMELHGSLTNLDQGKEVVQEVLGNLYSAIQTCRMNLKPSFYSRLIVGKNHCWEKRGIID